MIGVAYTNTTINATTVKIINAGLTNLIVNAAIKTDAINTNSADNIDEVCGPVTNVFSGSCPNVLFNVSTSLSYIFILSPYYNANAVSANTPNLSTTKLGNKPMTKHTIKKITITAIVVFGSFADDTSKSSGFSLRNIA